MSETRLRDDRWRVRQYVVPVPRELGVARPWQLKALAPAPPPSRITLYGVWPPHWALASAPMLLFPQWHMAFRAAWDRAQFAHNPPPNAQPTYAILPNHESELNG